jgi:hypothetical protein
MPTGPGAEASAASAAPRRARRTYTKPLLKTEDLFERKMLACGDPTFLPGSCGDPEPFS